MAEQNINVAQQDTLESISSKIDTLDTVADNIYSKVDTEIAEVKAKTDLIGATGDTGGSATAGSIMAKLNGIFTNAARLTSAHATKIDNIGATGDTGGTASAGTVMGKLNAIISSLANIGGSSVNASDITAIKTATEATTTENASGTLSAKLSYLINRRDRIVTPSSTNLKTLSTNLSLTTTADKLSGNSYTTVGKSWYSSNTNSVFIKHDGTYRIYCTASLTMQTNNSGNSYAYFQVIVGTSGLPAQVYEQIIFSSVNSTQSAKTVFLDIPLSRGSYVHCRLRNYSDVYLNPCVSSNYTTDVFTTTATDISLRGTSVEINSII